MATRGFGTFQPCGKEKDNPISPLMRRMTLNFFPPLLLSIQKPPSLIRQKSRELKLRLSSALNPSPQLSFYQQKRRYEKNLSFFSSSFNHSNGVHYAILHTTGRLPDIMKSQAQMLAVTRIHNMARR